MNTRSLKIVASRRSVSDATRGKPIKTRRVTYRYTRDPHVAPLLFLQVLARPAPGGGIMKKIPVDQKLSLPRDLSSCLSQAELDALGLSQESPREAWSSEKLRRRWPASTIKEAIAASIGFIALTVLYSFVV